MSKDNFNLLTEIDNYIENKEEIYNKIKNTDIEKLIITDDKINRNAISPLNTPSFIDRQSEFHQFLNKQYENNIEISSYLNDKITMLNKTILDNEYVLNKLRNENINTENADNVARRQIEIEHNTLLINRIKTHVLTVSILSVIIMILVCLLNYYNVINKVFVMLISILIIIGNILYILKIYYSKYPRRNDDYMKYLFKTKNDKINTPMNNKLELSENEIKHIDNIIVDITK